MYLQRVSVVIFHNTSDYFLFSRFHLTNYAAFPATATQVEDFYRSLYLKKT